MHDIALDLPDFQDESDEILFSSVNLPQELYNLFSRFTRLPNSNKVMPFLVAYELLPLNGLKNIPFLFFTGPSGSGKSTFGEIAQRLNPKGHDDASHLTGGDTYKGWEQSLSLYRHDLRDREKAFPLVFIDDLTPGTFSAIAGDLKLHFLKQIVSSTGQFSRGSADGTAITIKAFCKLITGSIHNLPSLEGLCELERRVLKIKTKNVGEWDESDIWEDCNATELENHHDYLFSPLYDEIRYIYINSIAVKMMEDRKKCKTALLKFPDLIPKNRIEFVYPIISLSYTLGFHASIHESISDFGEYFYSVTATDSESAIIKLTRAWLFDEGSPYSRREYLFKRSGIGYSIKLSEVHKFLQSKAREGELNSRSLSRDAIVQCMSTLGYTPSIEGTDTLFKKGDDSNDE